MVAGRRSTRHRPRRRCRRGRSACERGRARSCSPTGSAALRGSSPRERQAHAQRLAQSPVPYHAVLARDERGGRASPAASSRSRATSSGSTTCSPPRQRAAGSGERACRHLLALARAARRDASAICRSTPTTTPARAVYRRLGFADGYAYHYRTPPTAPPERRGQGALRRAQCLRPGRGARSSTAPRRRSRPCRGCRGGHQHRLRVAREHEDVDAVGVVARLHVEVAVVERRRVAQAASRGRSARRRSARPSAACSCSRRRRRASAATGAAAR